MRSLLVFPKAVLRTESRRLRTYILRLTVCVVIGLFLLQAYEQQMWLGAAGLSYFTSITVINVIILLLAGISTFASVITEEKEQGTMGLLRMTPMSAPSVLLGKTVGRLLGVTSVLLLQLPFVVLAVTLGGVSLQQVFAVEIALLGFMVLMCGLGLFWSVLLARSRSASLMVGVTVVAVVMVRIWALSVQAGAWRFMPGLFVSVATVVPFERNIVTRLVEILGTGWGGGLVGYQAWRDAAVGAGLFGASCLLYGRFARDSISSTGTRPWRFRGLFARRNASDRDAATLRRRPAMRRGLISPGRAWRWPIVWKDFNFLTGGVTGAVGKVVLVAVLMGAFTLLALGMHEEPDAEDYGTLLFVIMCFLTGLELVVQSGRIFNREWRWGTLQMQGMLPVSVAGLAWRKIAGHALSMIPNAVLFVFALLLNFQIVEDFFEELEHDSEFFWGILVFVAGHVAFFQLTATLSLYLQRGALVGAVAVAFVTVMAFGFFVGWVSWLDMLDEETVFFLICLALTAAAVVLHLRMLKRLATLLGQD